MRSGPVLWRVAPIWGLLGVSALPASGQTFTDVTKESGLEALRATRATDFWLSGLQFVDLDGDGRLDFYFGAHRPPGGAAALNDGKGKFTPIPNAPTGGWAT